MFVLSLLGIVLTLGGIFVMYLYINSLNTTPNIVFLVGSLAMVGGAVYLFILAGKSDTVILKRAGDLKPDTEPVITPVATDPGASKLAENNKMLRDWEKTNETKERLRMLEMSASAGEE